AATATPYPPHPASQGYVHMLGVFIDTIVICTATASLILLSQQLIPESGVLGIELTQAALSEHVGSWGTYFIAIAILFFAFTSIVANY
ncbi:alanine:cation symporter family protein, partial [Pseudomonas sp. SIMBA_021]|uniref:alanine:cation symporter family protein n=1 Tax=Pseudomonas sp. SIMBA_021 TaxID=3085767 RepID=UPI00397D0B0E